MGKAFRCARYVESPFWPSFTIHQIILKFLPFIVLFFRTLLFSLFVALTEKRYLVLAWPWHELKTVLNGSTLFPISIAQHKDKQYCTPLWLKRDLTYRVLATNYSMSQFESLSKNDAFKNGVLWKEFPFSTWPSILKSMIKKINSLESNLFTTSF